jgi:PleD family two-component response regulator
MDQNHIPLVAEFYKKYTAAPRIGISLHLSNLPCSELTDMGPGHMPFEEEKEIFHKSANGSSVRVKKNILFGPNILIVDDQMFLLDALRMILEDLGLEVDIALGGN